MKHVIFSSAPAEGQKVKVYFMSNTLSKSAVIEYLKDRVKFHEIFASGATEKHPCKEDKLVMSVINDVLYEINSGRFDTKDIYTQSDEYKKANE